MIRDKRLMSMIAALSAWGKGIDVASVPSATEPSMPDMRLMPLDFPGISYPGQMKQARMLRDGYRDVYNPKWRAWAKLKPLAANA